MKDTDLALRLKWITDAVTDQDMGLNALSCYLVRDGFIHATDGRMTVGTPFPFDGAPCLVPSDQFEKVVVNKPDGDFTWEREDDRLVLKRGRFKGRIKTLPLDQWVMPLPDRTGGVELPDGLIDGLVRLIPFVSENATKPWATCIGIIGDHMYASNNIAVARVHCPNTVGWDYEEIENPEADTPDQIAPPTGYLLPRWVAEFIIKREAGLVAWHCDQSRVTFWWEDGSWMYSSLIVDTYPPVQSILDRFFQGAVDVPIEREWLKSLKRISKIAEDAVIRLRADECAGSSGESLSVEDGAGAPVPDGLTETVWDLRYLIPVLEVATHWNPRTYPSPAPWQGEGIQGIIAGRRD